MLHTSTYSDTNRQINSLAISIELDRVLKELSFFSIGKTIEIIAATESGEIDEEEDPKTVVVLSIETRQKFSKLLGGQITAEAVKVIGCDLHAPLPIDPIELHTLRTLNALKRSIENKEARYISFSN